MHAGVPFICTCIIVFHVLIFFLCMCFYVAQRLRSAGAKALHCTDLLAHPTTQAALQPGLFGGFYFTTSAATQVS